MNFFQHLKKYRKDWMIVLLVVMLVFFSVMGFHFSEVAKKPFWWNFWEIIAIACVLLWLGGWLYFSSQDKKKKYDR